MSSFDLADRVAVVTGASGNLGPIWIRALTDAGAAVVAVDLPTARRTEAFKAIAADDARRIAVVDGDVTDRASLEIALSACKQRFGPPDVLVNNAGIDQPPAVTATAALTEIDSADVQSVLAVNLVGAFTAMQVFGGAMAERGRGSIVNIGSLYASVSPDPRFYDHIATDPPFIKPPAYGASKAGLVNLTKFFATHWGTRGVRVNALSPGGVRGGQDEQFVAKFNARVPLARMAEASDLGGPLVFLASDASSYVTGIDLVVDGGFTAW